MLQKVIIVLPLLKIWLPLIDRINHSSSPIITSLFNIRIGYL